MSVLWAHLKDDGYMEEQPGTTWWGPLGLKVSMCSQVQGILKIHKKMCPRGALQQQIVWAASRIGLEPSRAKQTVAELL